MGLDRIGGMATSTATLVACLQIVQALSLEAEDNAKSYSRIFVASPGERKYTYGITHDREGRDFIIDFNPLDADVDMDNILRDRQGLQHQKLEAKYSVQEAPAEYEHYVPGPDYYEQIKLKVKTPSHHQMQKSVKEIQAVHAAYSKGQIQPPKKTIYDDFDLGLMGYGDFMDSHDIELSSNPEPIPQSTPKPNFSKFYKSPKFASNQIKFQPQIKLPLLPPKKNIYPKIRGQKQFVQNNFKQPQIQYGFKPMKPNANFQKALFVPSFDDSRLHGLADKAYSKVFMSQGHAEPIAQFYPKEGHISSPNFSKTLFVPVVLMPRSDQAVVERVKPSVFEPMRKFTKETNKKRTN